MPASVMPSISVPTPLRVTLPSSSSSSNPSISIPRPLVRSAGGLILPSQPHHSLPSYHSTRHIYTSDEDQSGDDEPLSTSSSSSSSSFTPSYPSLSPPFPHAPPHYSAVYANIRHGAAAQAQRARDRQLQLQLHNARMQQQKLIHAAQQHQQVKHFSSPPLPQKALRVPPSTSSTSSTISNGSASSHVSRYSEEGSARSVGSRRGRKVSPQHFKFSVDDIDKALTEEELDEWFDLEPGRESEEEEEEEAHHVDVSLSSHSSSLSPSPSSSSSDSTPPFKPSLSINTTLSQSPSSPISILPNPSRRRHGPPQTFTFSSADIRKSEKTKSEELQVGDPADFPKAQVRVCDLQELRGRLRMKREEWERGMGEEKGEEKKEVQTERRPNVCRRLFVEQPVKRQPQVMWRRDAQPAPVAPYYPPQAASQAHRRSMTEQAHHTYFHQQQQRNWQATQPQSYSASPQRRYLYTNTSPCAPQPVRGVHNVAYQQRTYPPAASSPFSESLFSPQFKQMQRQQVAYQQAMAVQCYATPSYPPYPPYQSTYPSPSYPSTHLSHEFYPYKPYPDHYHQSPDAWTSRVPSYPSQSQLERSASHCGNERVMYSGHQLPQTHPYQRQVSAPIGMYGNM